MPASPRPTSFRTPSPLSKISSNRLIKLPLMQADRKLRMGMVGGGQGSFIGAVHRLAAALDQQVDLVAGFFSRDEATSQAPAARLHVDSARAYKTYEEMAKAEAALPADQ